MTKPTRRFSHGLYFLICFVLMLVVGALSYLPWPVNLIAMLSIPFSLIAFVAWAIVSREH